ncbi:MAG: CTP synthase [Clostridia bacterium]
MQTKLIFVTGGVVSGLGKGITASALGRLLKSRGISVSICKLDPYLNVDPGTMNPYQHGEVYVTDDGAETDLDIGHYERFINENLTKANNATSGQIYSDVIDRERKGGYNGGTVQLIPHITNEIKARIMRVANETKPDVLIVEIGGTVGDMESLPFLEAIRQLKWTAGPKNTAFIHVTLVPYIKAAGELKSKPTQNSVKDLLSIGIQPDIIVCRSDYPLNAEIRKKIALFCNVDPSCVIENLDADSLYSVPLMLESNGLCTAVLKALDINAGEPLLDKWRAMVERESHPTDECTVAIVGKYIELHDAYLSIVEALKHGGIQNEARINIKWVSAENVSFSNAENHFRDVDAILIPGGFGERGLNGKITAARFAREHEVPFFGICLGMQMACVEFARNVMKLQRAHSSEADPMSPDPVIDIMEDQIHNLNNIGGTLRLGGYFCELQDESSISFRAYGKKLIRERHRHRYEFNNSYREAIEKHGMKIVGINPERDLVEIVELEGHPWYVGVQFHPEFSSRPDAPHPLFVSFIAAALKHHKIKK